MSEGNNTTGGYLVPIEFSNTLINLRNEYGVFRRFAFVDTMISDTKNTPRLTGHAQHYYVGEGGSITPSYITLDQIKLIAKKPAILIIFSRELADDSMIALGNLLADELAWTMSYAEDLAGFNGDGTSTYGGIVGVINQLTTINGVDDGGGIALAATSHNLYSELTLDDFTNTIARCPAYAKRNARWYCSSYFYSAVMLRLLANVSGNTIQSIEMGASAGPIYLGYPVIFSEVLSTVQANSQICCLFGDLAKAATLGDRQGITIEYSNAATIGSVNLFETDQTAIRGLERYDINVHDVGTATVAGPVVGLMTAAS
jgi:HK97 family phage major capsid protein